jgi:4-amino-4-deoxy-L-arabinose transferase-like glycosyltransferase
MALILIMLLGAWLRFYSIDSKSLWIDEGVTAEFTYLSWPDFLRILWHSEGNMALYDVLLRVWTQMGDSVAMLRGFSALISLATIPALYALGRRLFSTSVGLASALLLAFNAYAVRYAQEVRSYSLVTLLVTLATYFLVNAVLSGRKRDWSFYVIASALAIYAHFFAVLVVVGHGISLESTSRFRGKAELHVDWLNNAVQRFRHSVLYILLCTLPVWIFIFAAGTGTIQWIHPPTLDSLFALFLHMSGNALGAFRQHISEHSWIGLLCLSLCPLYLALAALGTARSMSSEPETSAQRWRRLLPLYWFSVPVAISLAFSLIKPVFVVRYLIICLPALVLMAGAGAMSFRQPWRKLIALVVVCLLATEGVRAYYAKDFDVKREDFRSASEYVLARSRAGDAVLFYQSFGRFPFSYYADHTQSNTRPTIIFPGTDARTWRNFTDTITPTLLSGLAQAHGRLWLVLSENMHGQDEDAISTQIRNSVGRNHRQAAMHQCHNVRVYLYER